MHQVFGWRNVPGNKGGKRSELWMGKRGLQHGPCARQQAQIVGLGVALGEAHEQPKDFQRSLRPKSGKLDLHDQAARPSHRRDAR